jgi:Flp pilus assembly protein TadG
MRRRGEAGQATVEFALALPLLALFLLAAAQVVVVARDQLAVVHAAREAARAAAVSTEPGDGAAAGHAAADLPGTEITVAATGDQVVATVQRTVPTDVPLVGRLLPDIVVRARAVMRVEG